MIEGALFDCGGCPKHAKHWALASPYFDDHQFQQDYGWSDEEMRLEVLTTWDKIRYPLGWDPLELAFTKALAVTLPLKGNDEYDSFFYQLFVSLAVWLQVAMGDRPILLPTVKLAERFKCAPKTISRYRELAERAGYLEMVAPHSYGRRRATEFRVHTELWPELHRRTQKSAAGGNQDGAEGTEEQCLF